MVRAAHVISTLLALAGVAAAAPAKPTTITAMPIAKADLPDGVGVRGATFDHALTFRDKRGTHYLVLSATDTSRANADGVSMSRTIYVDDWLVAGTAKPRSLLPVRDMVTDCMMGAIDARFHNGATVITDLDHDGIAEVTIAYELACRSDVSPATYKLLVLEDGTKYILRGETRVAPDENIMGGTFTPDPAPARWPAGFLEHAKRRWDQTADDLQSPPPTRP